MCSAIVMTYQNSMLFRASLSGNECSRRVNKGCDGMVARLPRVFEYGKTAAESDPGPESEVQVMYQVVCGWQGESQLLLKNYTPGSSHTLVLKSLLDCSSKFLCRVGVSLAPALWVARNAIKSILHCFTHTIHLINR